MARIPLWKVKKAQRQARQHCVATKRRRELHTELFGLFLANKIDIFELCHRMKYQRR